MKLTLHKNLKDDIKYRSKEEIATFPQAQISKLQLVLLRGLIMYNELLAHRYTLG